jgi:hypothetical protein
MLFTGISKPFALLSRFLPANSFDQPSKSVTHKTIFFCCQAKAISESVPAPPPAAISMSAVFMIIMFRAIPCPVAMGMSIYAFTLSVTASGKIPIV